MIQQRKAPERNRKKAREEVSSLFNKRFKQESSRKPAKPCWRHKFVCLSSRSQQYLNAKDFDKDDLLRSGLGEKEVEFHSMQLDADEFRELLYEANPTLKHG